MYAPPLYYKRETPVREGGEGEDETGRQRIDSSTVPRATRLSVDVGYYAPAARTTLNPRVFLCAPPRRAGHAPPRTRGSSRGRAPTAMDPPRREATLPRRPRRSPPSAEPPSSVTGSPRGPYKRRRGPASPRLGAWKRRPCPVAGPPLDECVAVDRDAILRRPSAATQNVSGVCVVGWRGYPNALCQIYFVSGFVFGYAVGVNLTRTMYFLCK